ncbi:lipase, partial [Helicobacter didelphidarum]
MATNKIMINKFKNMADCADAVYAKLDFVFEDIDAFFDSDKWNEADGIRLGNQTKENDRYLNGREILPNSNTAYARAIEARFNQDKVIGKEGDWCVPFTKACLSSKDKTLANDPKNVSPTDTLSLRTQN